METAAGPVGGVTANDELRRLAGAGSIDRTLLVHRVEVFAGVGAALGALHLVTPHAAEHVALTALFAALVPVFAPLCFLPVAFDQGEWGGSIGVLAARIAVTSLLGWCVAGVHLLVWLFLAEAVGSIGAPGAGDIPFMAVTVVLTATVVSGALVLPRSRAWGQAAATAASALLYVGAFFVHAGLLAPSISTVRSRMSAGPGATEVLGTAVALVLVILLLRRELRAADHEGRHTNSSLTPPPEVRR